MSHGGGHGGGGGGIVQSIIGVFAIAFLGLTFAVTHAKDLPSIPPTQSAAVQIATDTTNRDFSEQGTLTFYPSNVGQIPYLFYTNTSGHTVSKALRFAGAAPLSLGSWSGARVSVQGHLTNENVLVSSINYVSGP